MPKKEEQARARKLLQKQSYRASAASSQSSASAAAAFGSPGPPLVAFHAPLSSILLLPPARATPKTRTRPTTTSYRRSARLRALLGVSPAAEAVAAARAGPLRRP